MGNCITEDGFKKMYFLETETPNTVELVILIPNTQISRKKAYAMYM